MSWNRTVSAQLTSLCFFQARADTSFSSEIYDDTNDLFSSLQEKLSKSDGVSVGVGLAKVPVTVDVGVSGSYASTLLNSLKKYNKKVLKHNVCVAH